MINEKYAVLITGFGKGIGRDILFECSYAAFFD